MTREEAIDILEYVPGSLMADYDFDETCEALDMAIDALRAMRFMDYPRCYFAEVSEPAADRPRPIDPTIKVDLESGVVTKTIIYADRPRGKWHYSNGKPATIGRSFGVICDQCGAESEYCTNFCGECGADMRDQNTARTSAESAVRI